MTSYEYGDGKSSPFSLVLDYFSRAGSSISEFVDQSEGQSSETTRLLDNGTKKRLFGIETERCDEIPSFIQERRKEFHDELQRIDSKTAFGHAIQQAPQYVESLEISFLRAEDWNPRKASIRMLNFFEAKSSLFGLQVLGRRLQIDDLDSDDQICLRSGSFQILPSRDKDSKRVLCFFPKNSADDRTRSLMKAWWYFVMRLVEAGNDNYKRSDFAGVIYHVDSIHNFLGLDRNLYWHVIGSLKQLPINISEWHYCHDDFLIYTVSPFFAYYISKDDGSHKTKWHLHNGSQTECTYHLLQSGLPAHELPLTESGVVELRQHHNWLKEYCNF